MQAYLNQYDEDEEKDIFTLENLGPQHLEKEEKMSQYFKSSGTKKKDFSTIIEEDEVESLDGGISDIEISNAQNDEKKKNSEENLLEN